MKTIQYWGVPNVQERAITGTHRLWYTGMKCVVTDEEAASLKAYSADFLDDQSEGTDDFAKVTGLGGSDGAVLMQFVDVGGASSGTNVEV